MMCDATKFGLALHYWLSARTKLALRGKCKLSLPLDAFIQTAIWTFAVLEACSLYEGIVHTSYSTGVVYIIVMSISYAAFVTFRAKYSLLLTVLLYLVQQTDHIALARSSAL